MQFIDHTGHLFSLDHFSHYPVGYEYNETPYIFWFKDEYTTKLSINCVYIQSIRIAIPEAKISSMEILCENSNYFRLISPKTIQNKISKAENIFNIELDYFTNNALNIKPEAEKDNDFKEKLTFDDLLIVDNLYKKNWFWNNSSQITKQYLDVYNLPEPDENGNRFIIDPEDNQKYLLVSRDTNYTMVPFYVAVCGVPEEGSWMTNILININTIDGGTFYCPITVGGTFVDENEALIINGKNIGVELPKDICKAMYNTNFSTDYVDLSTWNTKIKEYLLQHIRLKSERGNYRSAIDALKWFGWDNKLELSALIETDNEFKRQYILDKFDLNYDVINEFRYFRNAALLNLFFKGEIEDKDNINDYNLDNEFWGEGKPNTINLFDEIIEKRYDEEDIPFYRPYYEFTFNEIGLKLSALKYYYEKYFLPIHLSIYHSTITNQTFANNIKLTNSSKTLLTAQNVYVADNINVKFPENYDAPYSILWLSEQTRYIDIIDEKKKFSVNNSNWIEFDGSKTYEYANKFSDYHVFEISDNCFSLPIKFISKSKYKYYSCVLVLRKIDNDIPYTVLPEHMYQQYFENNINLYYFDYDVYDFVKIAYDNKNDWKEESKKIEQYDEVFAENSVVIKTSKFDFIGEELETTINFVICPSLINKNFNLNYWLDSQFSVELLVNGKLFKHTFYLDVPELDIEMSKLEYKYDHEVCKQFIGFDNNRPIFNSFMYVPDLVKVSNINFIDDYINYMKNSYMHYIDESNQVFKNNVYYYYYNKDGSKEILSSGNFVLIKNKYSGKYQLVRRDVLDIIKNMSPEEIEENFPDIERYLSYDGDIEDIEDENLRKILTEINDKIQLDYGLHNKSEVVTIPDDVTLYSSVYKNIFSFLDLYSERLNIPKNNNFFNKIHLFEIKRLNDKNEFENIPYKVEDYTSDKAYSVLTDRNGEFGIYVDGKNKIYFGDNDSEQIKELYSLFFNIENGEWDKDIFYLDKDDIWKPSKLEQQYYDFYLMHDNDIWYGVMISKDVIGDDGVISVQKTYKLTEDIYLRLDRTDEKMLINRMDLVDMKNHYHFTTDDMIVAKLNNYTDIPFKLIAGSKWTFTPLGIGASITDVKESNTNFALLSMSDKDIKHTAGYYSVKVAYSIDNFVNNTQERKTVFLIE